MKWALACFVLLAWLSALPTCVAASLHGAMASNGVTDPKLLKEVGIDQKLGGQLPLDQVFYDENSHPVTLGSLIGKRPIVLTLVYFRCPMLCTMVLNDLVQSMRQMKKMPGKDFDILSISFDPSDTPTVAREKKASYLSDYGHPEAAKGWHFLTGSPAAIAAVTKAVGFRYTWDPATHQFAHASGIIVLTPTGQISRYFYGVNYEPKDLRLAIVQASDGRVGTLADQILLFCCSFDPTTGRYDLAVARLMKMVGVAMILAVGLLIGYAAKRRAGSTAQKDDLAGG